MISKAKPGVHYDCSNNYTFLALVMILASTCIDAYISAHDASF